MEAETDTEKQSIYHTTAAEVATTVVKKQAAYGDSFGKAGEVLKIFYPRGVFPDQYQDMLCLVRMIDKLFRIANDRFAFGEDPYLDMAGYSLLGAVKNMAAEADHTFNFWVEED